MAKNLYVKLATTNIKKNRDINLPYMIAITIITAMYYLVVAMLDNKGLKDIPSNGAMVQCFTIANYIIGIIASIFILYINSFLIKKRLKEFGLYNILGLEKKHVIYVMIIENVIVFGGAILCGMIFGTVFGKLSFMMLLKVCHFTAESQFILSINPYIQTIVIFGVLFIVCSFINIIMILKNKTIDLLHSDKFGEKKMRGMIMIPLTIIGLVLMVVAYYIANTTVNYVQAIQVFFPAVMMVIIATYLLFMTGSVVLLNILKKNKKFYYKANNFISTSSLIYRMKQNAVGLANICILSTMAIVTAAGCSSLYLGQETINKQFNPFDLTIEEQADTITEDVIRQLASKDNVQIKEYFEFDSIDGAFWIKDNSALKIENITSMDIDRWYDFLAVSAEEYNRVCGTDIKLETGHIVLASLEDMSMFRDGMKVEGTMYQVDDILSDSQLLTCKNGKIAQRIYIVCSNEEEAIAFTNLIYESKYETNEITSTQYINYEGDKNDRLQFGQDIVDVSTTKSKVSNIDTNRVEAYGTYGGILFIGIFFILIFITITILIIYFKQVTEGFDDRERFVILQKVGMDAKMVKQTINRQIIIVFFAPLILALIHLVGASNIIQSMMTAFYMVDISLILKCIVATSAIFAAIYVVVFKLTAKTYYKIVKF